MSSLSDFMQTGGTSGGLGTSFVNTTPQPLLNSLPQNMAEDAAIASSRGLQDYATRSLPALRDQGAAMGQWGSSGLSHRADMLTQDVGRQQIDIHRMLMRNQANISQQRALATYGGVFG